MSDGFAWLEEDHRAIEREFESFVHDDEISVVYPLCEHLTRHTQIEEAALYPALRRFVDGGDDLADRAEQEHSVVKTMIADIYDSATPDQLDDRVAQLRSAVSAHVEEEESEIFPAMRSCGVDPEQLAADLGV